MDVEAFVHEMFNVDSSIRYIAVVTGEYRVLASKQREGVPTFASDEAARNFISIVPQIIVESVEKLSPFLGKVGGITAHYEKVLMIFYHIDDLIIIISFQPEAETPFFNKITQGFTKLSARYLK